MPFTFLPKTGLSFFALAGAILLCGGFFAPATRAEPFPPVQGSPIKQAENASASVYNPPADVPVPQPKIKPAANILEAPASAPQPAINQNSSGQNSFGLGSPPEQAGQNAALPQNFPVPSPAPAPLPGGQAGSAADGQKSAAPGANNADGKASGTENIGLADAQKLAQNLADKFSQIRTMMGEFIQFDARGGMTTGTFYLERPGKILFDYKDTPLRVICDGQTIAVNNRKLRSWSLYELGKSPLSLLLADKITIANGRLLEFTQEPAAITLVLGDATGRAKIRMIFDAKTYELKQWTMTENGQDTTIQVMNTKTDIEFADNMFNINYYRFPKKR